MEQLGWTAKKPKIPLFTLNNEEINIYFQGYEGCINRSLQYLQKSTFKIRYPKILFSPQKVTYIKIYIDSYHSFNKKYQVFIKKNEKLEFIYCKSCSRGRTGLCAHSAAACFVFINRNTDLKEKSNFDVDWKVISFKSLNTKALVKEFKESDFYQNQISDFINY